MRLKSFSSCLMWTHELLPEHWFYSCTFNISCIVRMSGSHPLLCSFVSRYWILHYWVLEYNLNVMRYVSFTTMTQLVVFKLPMHKQHTSHIPTADLHSCNMITKHPSKHDQVTETHIIRKYNSLVRIPTTYLRQPWRGQSSKLLVLYKESTKKTVL